MITIVIYFLILLIIGYVSSKKIDINEDFAVAGRRLNQVLLACTLVATEIGVGSSLGVFEKAYGEWGLSSSWYILSMGIAFVILSIFAPKFRKSEVKTVPEFFRRRYGAKSGLITTILMILPLLVLSVIQLVAAGKLLSIFLGLDYKISVSIIAFVIITYLVLGGLWSTVYTDFFQLILIVVGLFLVFIYSIRLCSNLPKALSNLPLKSLDLFNGMSTSTIITLVIMYITTFTVGQEISVSFYSIKHSYNSSKGTVLASFLMVCFAFIPTFLGLITLALENVGYLDISVIFKDGLTYALPNLALQAMPNFIIGILFVSLISVVISSADSDILAIGTIFSNDIYKVYIDKKATTRQVLFTSRLSIVVFGLIVYLLALFNSGSIIEILIFVFSLRAAGAFVPYIFGLYWPKSSTIGANASLIIGSISFILLEIYHATIFTIQPIIISLILSLISFIFFSKKFPPLIETVELVDEEIIIL